MKFVVNFCGETFIYIFFMQLSVYANILRKTCNTTAHSRPKMLLSSVQSYHINTTTSCPYRLSCPSSLLFCRYEDSSTPSSRIKRVKHEDFHVPSSSSDVKNECSHTSTPSTFRYHGEKQLCLFKHFLSDSLSFRITYF